MVETMRMRSYLSPDERREYSMLAAQLAALDRDIAIARAKARHARTNHGLDLHAPREPHAAVHGERVRLADGGEIVVRPIEPGDAHDLAAGVQRLSELSRFRRFRAAVDRLTPEQLTELTHLDHESHEAMVALDAATGEGIGVARYVRATDDPTRAEFTCAVLDAWQRRGVGTALLERLATCARAVGIERFTALTVVGDPAARRLVARVAEVVSEQPAGGTVELRGHARGSSAKPGVP
jgi:GNAT superfamily N-acetyltransferase